MLFDESPLAWASAACKDKPPHWWFALPWFRNLRPAGSPPYTRWEALTRERARAEARRVHAEALKVCVTCPLVAQCAEWGLSTESYGVWGGITEWERWAIGGMGTPLNTKQPSLNDALVAISTRFGPRVEEIRPVILRYAKNRRSMDRAKARVNV